MVAFEQIIVANRNVKQVTRRDARDCDRRFRFRAPVFVEMTRIGRQGTGSCPNWNLTEYPPDSQAWEASGEPIRKIVPLQPVDPRLTQT
jgi:hypothetical protein